MKKVSLTITLLILAIQAFAFDTPNDRLIELGKYYRQFMFMNAPPESVLADFDKYKGTDLEFVADFIKETITVNNHILSNKFLQRPSDSTLKLIYVIQEINENIRKEKPVDNNQLIQSLLNKAIPSNELLSRYYTILMIGNGNKNKPFDLSTVNFELNKYGLKNDTEKDIVFLQIMRDCGSQIWGFMNVVKPPNYPMAYASIEKFPKFNGSPYYQFLDLNFPDFETVLTSDDGAESYKAYYIDKYYDVLITHLDCLIEAGDKEKYQQVLLGSILKESMYYKYSKKEKRLKKLLKKVKG